MGISSDGILVFGIDFDEDFPLLRGKEEDEDLEFEDILAADAGIEAPKEAYPETEDDPDYERITAIYSKYWAAKRELEKNSPVSLTWHCSYDYPMYILSVNGTKMRASRGYPEAFDPQDLVVSQDKIDALRDFCERHGLEYSEPKWLLCSMYG